jgi:hypothetical protein
MKTGIKDFFKQLREKERFEKRVEELHYTSGTETEKFTPLYRQRMLGIPNITFSICYKETIPGQLTIPNSETFLFRLDDEDLKYFADKYRPQLQKELEENIATLKNEYDI